MFENNIILKITIRVLAVIGLILTILPSLLHFSGVIEMDTMKTWMAIGMFIWFLTGSFWLGKKTKEGV